MGYVGRRVLELEEVGSVKFCLHVNKNFSKGSSEMRNHSKGSSISGFYVFLYISNLRLGKLADDNKGDNSRRFASVFPSIDQPKEIGFVERAVLDSIERQASLRRSSKPGLAGQHLPTPRFAEPPDFGEDFLDRNGIGAKRGWLSKSGTYRFPDDFLDNEKSSCSFH